MQVTLANWRTAPFNRWAFHHVRELVPSADIPHDPARVRALPGAEAALSIDSFLGETDTDGMAIVQHLCFLLPSIATGYLTITIRSMLERLHAR